MFRKGGQIADDTVWLSQEQMIELFGRDRSVISRHIHNAFSEGEVDEENCLHFLQTNRKGRPEAFYNLDVVISVGYRVKSLRGTQFRRWATNVLREYAIRGIVINNQLAAEVKDVGRRTSMLIKLETSPDLILSTLPPTP